MNLAAIAFSSYIVPLLSLLILVASLLIAKSDIMLIVLACLLIMS
jgi:hypothetical protein